MSWLSKVLGLDKHPAELGAINAIGKTVLNGIEAASPVATALIKVLEAVGTTALSGPASVVSEIGTVVAVLDPAWVTQVETAVNSALTKAGVPEILVKELDALLETEFKALGLVK